MNVTSKNIVFVLTDQQRFDTLEALGNPVIKTPALNGLVRNGICFTRAYSPCPVCVPARYALLSGKMPHESGCYDNISMPDGNRSIMEALAEAGYQTHGVGKMHFTFPNTGIHSMWGFASRDISEEMSGPANDDFHRSLQQAGYGHVHDPHGVRSEMYYIPQPSQLPAHLHNTTWVADKSIEFLKRRDRGKPFFLMTSFIKPHPPFESPTPWNKLYRAAEMPLPKRPEGMERLLGFWNKVQNRYKYRDQGTDDHLLKTIKAAYYGAISFIDYHLNRLLEYIKAEGLAKDTLIVYTSDHGELLGDYNSFGKRCFLDSAARIPLIMHGPDVPKGAVCPAPVTLADLFPTVLQYAGVQTDRPCSGASLLDIAAGAVRRDVAYGQFQQGSLASYMAVSERYKYIYSAADDKEWLFDFAIDPQETSNKARNPMYRRVTERMRSRIIRYYQEAGYTEPVDGDAWKPYARQHMPDDPDAYLLFQDRPESMPDIPGYEREQLNHIEGFNPAAMF